ncbi:DeoR/GlpR family DNA-binding transcription regulator [Azoarcus olearius]|uniref:Glycerol-3-phosphate regulon repressor n=1 Tax=Azoarcus sp. (strain BH72) TaxID=418699 RepID=A1KC88_AZOSB|nr:DeoR/GlpR family DNA-binding transcription regulator [Azoarcus olearius]CAL96444.1 putative glycerol-3-phosphate regulon repressor [Azoarcus olearius]
MLQEERYQRICALLETFKSLSTERISGELDISRETVRRDVIALEAMGRLRRVHGGVVLDSARSEAPFVERLKVRAKEKQAIARAAVKLLQPGHTLFLDAGSTTLALTEELLTLSGLTIVTNSMDIAVRMAQAGESMGQRHEVIVLGGRLAPGIAATCGETTVSEIQRYRADFALLSPVAVDAHNGATSFDHGEAGVARAMAERAAHRVILADHSKIGESSRVSYCPVGSIDTLVTDGRARKLSALAEIEKAGPEVVVA